MKGLFCVAALASIVACSTADAACRTQNFSFRFGSDTSTAMDVTGGTPCPITLRAGSTSIFDSNVITSQPQNGTLAITSKSGVTYRPKAGFKGSDSFAFRVTGRGAQRSGSSTVSVSVRSQ